MPFEDIKQALLSMDDEKFSEAHLKQLLLYAPDSKEVRTAAMLGETFCDVTFIVRKKKQTFSGLVPLSLKSSSLHKVLF